MTKRILCLISFLAFACVTCFGQTSFQGLMPGQSTRADVERVLGRPVKQVTETLVEYAPRQLKLTHAGVTLNSGKIYVQYRDGSAASVARRIELIFCARTTETGRECNFSGILDEYDPSVENPYYVRSSGGTLDAFVKVDDSDGFKHLYYFGSPRYMVSTNIQKSYPAESSSELRWSFYSKELYESTAPRGDCTGMLRGEWDTNRGPMTFTRVDEFPRIRGTYSAGNGTFTGEQEFSGNISGEWKDDTGSGTMYLQLPLPGYKKFEGTWKRKSGSGPSEGVWEGRCVETKGGASGTN